jgi:PAS domain S-box-containing protein
MKVTTKLIAWTCIVGFLAFGAAVHGYRLLEAVKIGSPRFEFLRHNQEHIQRATTLKALLNQIETLSLALLSPGNLDIFKGLEARTGETTTDVNLQFTTLENCPDAASIRFCLASARHTWNEYLQCLSAELLPRIRQGNNDEARALVTGVQKRRSDRFGEQIDAAINALELHNEQFLQKTGRTVQREIRLAFVGLLLVFGFLTGATGHLVHSMIRRIKAIHQGLEAIEQGTFSTPLALPGNDEFCAIAENIQAMAETIRVRELELKRVKNYLSNIIESMPSLLISVDQNGIITGWNTAATRTLRILPQHALGKPLLEVLPILTPFKNHFDTALQTGQPKVISKHTLNSQADQYFRVSIFPLNADDEKGVVYRFDDISDIERVEEQLRQSQKMETVGILAGGLAHDFNNILTIIIGSTSLLNAYQEDQIPISPALLTKTLKNIDDAANRATNVVKQLLTLSRREKSQFTTLDLNVTIRQVLQICSGVIEKTIKIQFQETPDPVFVHGNSGQLEQALLNLCINAAHAMTIMRKPDQPSGGTLSLFLHSCRSDDPSFRVSHPEAVEDRHYCCLKISDTGVGMSPKILAKIFDPFFSTKVGKGTGLGLSMVFTIVQKHEGFIDVYSEEGVGTNFFLYLPKETTAHLFMETARPTMIKGEGLILIIDDEMILRQTGKAILERCGYSVLLAENGVTGIELFTSRQQEISGVVLDMVMPEMSGKEVAKALFAIKPDVKILLASGFLQDERVEATRNLGVRHFLQKPFSLESFSGAIQALLHRPGLEPETTLAKELPRTSG